MSHLFGLQTYGFGLLGAEVDVIGLRGGAIVMRGMSMVVIVFIFVMFIFILFVMMMGVVVPFMTLLVRGVGLGAYGLAGCD